MADLVAEGILKVWFRSRLLELIGLVRVEGNRYRRDEHDADCKEQRETMKSGYATPGTAAKGAMR